MVLRNLLWLCFMVAGVPAFQFGSSRASGLVRAHAGVGFGKATDGAGGGVGGDGDSGGAVVFTAEFGHVKQSLSTLLKFWLMGGCGDADGWNGTGELEAQHAPTGTLASIEIDVGAGTLKLTSKSAPSLVGNLQLGLYAQALLDELDDLAKTDEAEPKDRLCYPPEAVATARESLGVRREL
mmetsp:Transcript_82235/g.232829  ORF Transcript_82235/g.232829 Transcript_82235/m.232829 type:complete len:181 (-) Transcript_82235:466-1008(-)